LVDGAPCPSSVATKGYGGGSTKNKALVDRQYSHLTGMDLSEWEIILEELTCMGFIVKQETICKGDD
jgi:hypothetical protein